MSTCCSPTSMPNSGDDALNKRLVLSVLDRPGMRSLLSKMLEIGPCISSFNLENEMPKAELIARLSELRAVGLVQGVTQGSPCFCVNQKTLSFCSEISS
jgi:hypothetical protein